MANSLAKTFISGDRALPFANMCRAPWLSLLHLTLAVKPRFGNHSLTAISKARPSHTVLNLQSPTVALKRSNATFGMSDAKAARSSPFTRSTPPIPNGLASVVISATAVGNKAGRTLSNGAGSPFTNASIHRRAGLTRRVCTNFPALRLLPAPSFVAQAPAKAAHMVERNGLRCGISPAMKERLPA